MNGKIKIITTCLLTLSIVVLIISFSSTNLAVADEIYSNPQIEKLEWKITQMEVILDKKKFQMSDEIDPDKITKLTYEITDLENNIEVLYQKLTNLSKSEKTIPVNKIIKRVSAKWQSYYSSPEAFDKAQSEIEAYVNADLPKNGWNKKMVKEQIKQHNFESITGKKGHGHELVSLFVAKQQINGKYDESGPILRYHEWVNSLYPPPDTKNEINERIIEIVGSKDLVVLAKKMMRSLNTMAQHGNVPSELSDLDPQYWMAVTGAAVCMYESDCDSDALYANAELPRATSEQLQAVKDFDKNHRIYLGTDPPVECGFLPCAEATGWKKINKKHTVTAKVKAYKCDSDTCTFTKNQTKTGTVTLNVIPDGIHRFGHPGLAVEAVSQSEDSVAYNTVKGEIHIGNGKNSITGEGLGKASFKKYLEVDTRCGGREQNCGIATYTVTSDATRWVRS